MQQANLQLCTFNVVRSATFHYLGKYFLILHFYLRWSQEIQEKLNCSPLVYISLVVMCSVFYLQSFSSNKTKNWQREYYFTCFLGGFDLMNHKRWTLDPKLTQNSAVVHGDRASFSWKLLELYSLYIYLWIFEKNEFWKTFW